jgi:hypothetical protein
MKDFSSFFLFVSFPRLEAGRVFCRSVRQIGRRLLADFVSLFPFGNQTASKNPIWILQKQNTTADFVGQFERAVSGATSVRYFEFKINSQVWPGRPRSPLRPGATFVSTGLYAIHWVY